MKGVAIDRPYLFVHFMTFSRLPVLHPMTMISWFNELALVLRVEFGISHVVLHAITGSLFPVSLHLPSSSSSSFPTQIDPTPTPIYLLALQTLFKSPSFCASLLMQSSDSPIARTNPHRAYVWFSPVYLPFSSTFATEIWTEAWSLALMMRLVALHLRGTYLGGWC